MHHTSFKLVAVILLSAALGGTALAQGTMAQQDACRGDVFRLCANQFRTSARSSPACETMKRA